MTQSIQTQVRQACGRMKSSCIVPSGIVFSYDGYMMARSEQAALELFGLHSIGGETYMGLPFRVDLRQQEDVRVLDDAQMQGAIKLRVSFPMSDSHTQESEAFVIARALSPSQLCDMITAWAESRPTNRLGMALINVVARKGEFE